MTQASLAIVNGMIVNKNNFIRQSLVKIEDSRRSNIFCTTVAIGPNLLLTAKHCVQNEILKNNNFQLDVARFGNRVIKIKNIVPSHVSDLALVQLEEKIPDLFTALTVSSMKEVDQEFFLIAGFGKTTPNEKPDGQLRFGKLENPVLTFNDRFISIKLNNNQPSACGGDSGGALIGFKNSKPFLVGLINATDPMCSEFNGFIQPAYYLK